MKITKIAEQIGILGKRDDQREKLITTSEAHALWETLSAKYDAIHLTKILLIFTKDDDLKIILKRGIDALDKQTSSMEKIMKTYNVPLIPRPPEEIHASNYDVNIMSDDIIFRTIYVGMQSQLLMLMDNFNHSLSSIIRESFRFVITIEMDLYDAFTEYGKLKSFIRDEPSFRP